MSLVQLRQAWQVGDVAAVVVTDIVAVDGGYCRAIRIFAGPDGTDGAPMIEVVITADTAAGIKLTAPETTF